MATTPFANPEGYADFMNWVGPQGDGGALGSQQATSYGAVGGLQTGTFTIQFWCDDSQITGPHECTHLDCEGCLSRGEQLMRSPIECILLIDEAQNLTPHEVKTVITRAGERTKIVLTGDLQQIDQPYLDALSNGLSHLINRMTGQPLYAHITLEKGERSELADLASNLL